MSIVGYVRIFFRASWYICVDSLNIFSFDECLERRDSIDRDICLKIDGGWFDSLCIYTVSLGLQRKIKGDIEIVDDL